uniref:TSA: Wollemia nobilis Ref_Wollemi_Transcript_26054_591 transcribed RNA sequence n=1 Tax=Wollemia nobilis TaxID=56998 RepID=A0A0C9S198_9CONI
MGQLTAEQTSKFREAFCFFDKDEDGVLSVKEVGVAMRSAGENASEEQVQEMVKAKGKETVDLATFLDMMEARHVGGNKAEDDLVKAFRFLDRGQTGNIYVGELRHLLTSVGEKLSADEFDQWIDQDKDCDSNGRINVETLVNKLIQSK